MHLNGNRQAYVTALTYELPEHIVSNEQLNAENPDWDMARIEGKTGIKRRHIAAPDETASDLGYRAAERLLTATGIERTAVEVLLFCTQSPDYALPTSACILQHRLKLASHCAALDFNQGCSGYVYGLYLASSLIQSGAARNVLVITGETYSKFIHPRDRSVRVLFGDGAAATLISSDGPGASIMDFQLGTDGSHSSSLIVKAGGARVPRSAVTCLETTDENGSTRTDENLYMDGQDLFTFTLRRVPEAVNSLLAKSCLTREQVDWYIFHQANAYMNDAIRQKLKLDKSRVPMFLQDVGNTVSSTIPITLHNSANEFRPGQKVMLVGFGVGLSWGACLLDWDQVRLV